MEMNKIMLGLFMKRTRGSITVMVTLMLIPTIFFTGFLTDLARIKLFSNQAVMTADNYGETIIAEYDYVLKELYGLFAVTQDAEGIKALDDLQNYMKTSFDPAKSTIDTSHLAHKLDVRNTDYKGFMPYKNADVTLSYELVENSKLSNPEILSTQIGDFMRFRIIQGFMDNDSQDLILDALDEVQNTKSNADVIEKKDDFDNTAGEVLEKMSIYYETLKRINHYPVYIKNINTEYKEAKDKFARIIDGDHYKRYRAYTDLSEDEKSDSNIQRIRNLEEEDRSQEEKELLRIVDDYNNDSAARKGSLIETFDAVIHEYDESREDTTVDFDSFESLANDLVWEAREVNNAIETLQKKRDNLNASMNQENVSEDLKTGIQEDIQKVDELTSGTNSGANYIALAQCVKRNIEVNKDYSQQMSDQEYQMEQIRSDYLDDPMPNPISQYKPPLNQQLYDNFQSHMEYRELYKALQNTFEDGSNGDAQKAKDQKKKAKEEKEKAEKKLSEPEETTARDIPDSINIGDNGTGGGSSITDLIKTAASYFKMNNFANAGNRLLLKFYTVAYDFGMFSSRITNVKPKDSSQESSSQEKEEKAASLTGVTMGKNVNYLYSAELEYLFGGHKSSKANLDACKNHILAFRAVVNMTSTYSIDKINKPIKAIRDSLSTINPVLGIAAAAALRGGITALETAGDWDYLTQGKSVVLIKKDVQDMTSYDSVAALLGIGEEKSDNGKKKLELNYNQYLMVMVTFLTTSDAVTSRTADLISLNVSAVRNNVGENGVLESLSCDMSKAYTAVDATCAVHLDFAVMPKGFAQKTIDANTYNQVVDVEKNIYKFTVTRGY